MDPNALCLSLDEYIRKKDQFVGINRKKEQNIDIDELDADLDEINREARMERMDTTEDIDSYRDPGKVASCGKFNRPSMQDDSSGDENDLEIKLASLNSTIIKEEDFEDDLDGLKPFQTAESREGIRVRSQHFRLLPENLVDRPQGVKRLLPLPLEENERYKKHRFQNGKVHKRFDSRATSRTSFASHATAFSSSGSYVEKGKFSYKMGDRGILGIDRVKRGPQQEQDSPFVQHSSEAKGITVNMNWNGFFDGFTKVAEKLGNPVPAPPVTVQQTEGDEVSAAALRLLQVLKAKKNFAKSAVDF